MVKKAIRRSQATFSAHFTAGKMVSDAEGTGWMKQVIGRSAKMTKNVAKCRISYTGAGMLKKRGPNTRRELNLTTKSSEKCRISYAGAGILKKGPKHTTRAKFDPRIERQRRACAEKLALEPKKRTAL